jgi:integrase/recombinase XerD
MRRSWQLSRFSLVTAAGPSTRIDTTCMAALDAGVPLRDVQIAARHADPRTTTIYDRRRENFDRHAAYVVVAFVAGG